jgi:PAS domain S-box-containing protein
MLQRFNEFSDDVRTCRQCAEDAKRKAERTGDPASKIHFLKIETSWLSLARSYELTGVIAADLDRRGQFERARAGERQEPQKVVEEGAVDTFSQLVWLASIVESGDDAILGTNLEGIITSWNKGAERLFGYSAEDAIGQPAAILIPPDRQHERYVILSRIRRGDRVDHCETVRQRKDGTLVDVSVTFHQLEVRAGKSSAAQGLPVTLVSASGVRRTFLFSLARQNIELKT